MFETVPNQKLGFVNWESLKLSTFTSRFNVIYHIQHQIIVQYMTSISCYRFDNIPPHPLFSIENDQQVVKTYQTYESK